MAFLFYHLKVRNDDHCPICRRFYVSVHNTREDACNSISDNIDLKQMNRLKLGQIIWIDEWIRRRNGDKYHVFELTPDQLYDLSKYDISSKYVIDNYSDDDSNEDTKDKMLTNTTLEKVTYKKVDMIRYMFLCVRVRKNEWCPDNIKYYVSFHKTLDSAYNMALKYVGKDNKQKIEKEFVWISTDDQDESNGDHYQIIRLDYGKELFLNSYCKQIQPDEWC